MPRSFESTDEMDNFFDELNAIKDQNLEQVQLRGSSSAIGAPAGVINPKIENPNRMEDAKAEIVANKQIASEREDAWGKWKSKREAEKSAPFIIAAIVAYYFFS